MSDSRPQYSPNTLKLAERYGIDPARLDAIIGAPKETRPTLATDPTKEWIEERRFTTEPSPAVSPSPSPIAAQPIVSQAPQTANVEIPKEVRSTGSPLSDPPRSKNEYHYEKQTSTSPLTWILGIALIGLLIFFLLMRGCERETSLAPPQQPAVIDTAVVEDTTQIQDTAAVRVDTAAAPVSTPTPAASRRHPTSGSSRNVALSTTSGFMAQEKLAELKADGNRNAYIREVKRNGVTVYQVRTRR